MTGLHKFLAGAQIPGTASAIKEETNKAKIKRLSKEPPEVKSPLLKSKIPSIKVSSAKNVLLTTGLGALIGGGVGKLVGDKASKSLYPENFGEYNADEAKKKIVLDKILKGIAAGAGAGLTFSAVAPMVQKGLLKRKK